MALKASGADFRALQILQNADGAIFFLGGGAKALDIARMIFVPSMGEIQAGDVHAQAHQVAHSGFGVAGWADGANDLGAAVYARCRVNGTSTRFRPG